MFEDEASEGWRAWLDAEIAKSEAHLMAAPLHDKIKVWRRLDLLHALYDEPIECTVAPSARSACFPLGRRITESLAVGGAIVLGTTLVWLIAVGFRFAI